MNSNGSSMKFYALPIFGFLMMAFFKVAQGQMMAPSPATAPPPSNDSATIDQGIAYVLLAVALAVTYLFH